MVVPPAEALSLTVKQQLVFCSTTSPGLRALHRAERLLPAPAVGLLCRLRFVAQCAFQREKRERQLLQGQNQKLPEDHSMVA